jgi:hypothetical protein
LNKGKYGNANLAERLAFDLETCGGKALVSGSPTASAM